MYKHLPQALFPAILIVLASSCQGPASNNNSSPVSTAVVRADTLTYTTERYRQSSEHVMTTSEVTDTTAFSASYPMFNEPALDEIVRYALTNSDTAGIENVAKAFIAEYDEWVNESGYAHSWFSQHTIAVQQNTPSYVSLISDVHFYTGGAHGSYHTRFIHYDTNRKQETVLTDWVHPERMNELEAVAERIFRANEGIAPNQALDSYFFENSRFSLPDNFYIADGQIHFLYNIYEIKPYSEGQTTLSIPLAEVTHLMSDAAKQVQDEVSSKENTLR